MGSMWVLGGAPKAVELLEKILVAVLSWQWVSSPITASYWVLAGAAVVIGVGIVGSMNEVVGQSESVRLVLPLYRGLGAIGRRSLRS